MPVVNVQNYSSATPAPPIPDLTGILHLYSTFGIEVAYQNSSGLIIDGDENPIASTASSPYPLNWGVIGNPTLFSWRDQTDAQSASGESHMPDINTGSQVFTWNGSSQYAATTASAISAMNKLTIYCVFKTNTLAAAQALFQYSYTENYLTSNNNLFAAYLTAAGIITVTQKLNDVVDAFNSKIKTLADTNLHLLTVVFDRSVAGAGATVAKLDNSLAGWANVAMDTMSEDFTDVLPISIGLGQPLGADAYLNGVLLELWIYSGAKDASHQTSVYDWMKYTHPTIT